MPRSRLLAVLIVLSACLIGCKKAEEEAPGGWTSASRGAKAAGGVAVVDLDEVARRLGRLDEIGGELRQREASLNQQLQAMQSSYRQQYQDKLNQLAQAPPEASVGRSEQEQQLQVVQQKMNVQLLQAKKQAQTNLNSYQLTLINRFRAEVKPIAQEVAAQRGFSVVVPKLDQVLFAFDPAVDITDEVARRMLVASRTPQTAAAAAPATQPPAQPPSQPPSGIAERPPQGQPRRQ